MPWIYSTGELQAQQGYILPYLNQLTQQTPYVNLKLNRTLKKWRQKLIDNYYVYLAGPILGSTYSGATKWREHVITLFPENIVCLSPMRDKQYLQNAGIIDKTVYADQLSTPKGINTRDRNDVLRCDAVLVNFLDADIISVGTCIELGWADILRKPVVIAMKETDIHYHKMVRDIAGYIFPTIEESAEMVKKILLP